MDEDSTRLPVTTSQRWFARLSLAAVVAAVVVLLIGGARSIGVFLCGLLGGAVTLAGAWWVLSRRTIGRWIGALLVIAGPALVIAVYVVRDVLWAVITVLALVAVAIGAARAARPLAAPDDGDKKPEEPPPARPFLIMNPRSGDGKVDRFHLDEIGRSFGADVALLDGSTHVDVAALARDAAAGGADLLGVAGGDGTQALVAGVAAENGLPFMVIPAGTRNHLAMDLGLDRDHPDDSLQALPHGVEARMDLGSINGRTFVNNASFGAYAEIVQSPAYRADKRGVTLQMLPDLLSGQSGPHLSVTIDGDLRIENPKALLVSNNPYDDRDLAGLGRRLRLDTGVLGVIAVTVSSAAQAAELLRGRRASGLHRVIAHEVVVESDASEIPVGVDGEALTLATPVTCTIRPQALRIRVPRARLEVATPRPPIDAKLLYQEAVPHWR